MSKNYAADFLALAQSLSYAVGPVKLEICDWMSPDVVDVWDWVPPNPEDVHFLLEVDIGVVGEVGTETFQTVVATAEGVEWLKRTYADWSLPDRGLLVLEQYSWQALEERMQTILTSCEKRTWQDAVKSLQRQAFPAMPTMLARWTRLCSESLLRGA